LCADETCVTADCCFGMCADASGLKCGSGRHQNMDVAAKCTDAECSTCCVANPGCSDELSASNCTAFTYLDATISTCLTDTCTTEECCVPTPTCNGIDCGGGMYLDTAANCATQPCNTAEDSAVCCKQLTCASIVADFCGATYTEKSEGTTCAGEACTKAECCTARNRPTCEQWVEDNPSFCGDSAILDDAEVVSWLFQGLSKVLVRS
jgi:hypothetical protein